MLLGFWEGTGFFRLFFVCLFIFCVCEPVNLEISKVSNYCKVKVCKVSLIFVHLVNPVNFSLCFTIYLQMFLCLKLEVKLSEYEKNGRKRLWNKNTQSTLSFTVYLSAGWK